MKIKNPLRTWANWYGSNLVEIAVEPAGKAFMHYGKVLGQSFLIGCIPAAILGACLGGYYVIREKLEEKEMESY